MSRLNDSLLATTACCACHFLAALEAKAMGDRALVMLAITAGFAIRVGQTKKKKHEENGKKKKKIILRTVNKRGGG